MLLTILLASVPVVIWGYVFSYYDGVVFRLHKFVYGGIAGAVSIVPILYAAQIYEYASFTGFLTVLSRMGNSLPEFVGAFLASFWVPVGVFLVFLLAFSFSNLLKLRYTLFRVVGMILATSVVLGLLAKFFPVFGRGELTIQGNVFMTLSSIILVYVFVALLEETMKHVSLYGSISALFERKDILLFAVYSALGFVFLENIVYLSGIGENSGFGSSFFGTLASRSIVSLLLHVFASLILALGFIKYTRLGGLSAMMAFVQGLLGAVFVHALFNVSLTYGKSGIIMLYIFVGYFFFTKVFLDERQAETSA